MIATDSQLDLFLDTLPNKPYCTDTLGSLNILPKEIASTMRYIQPNVPWKKHWLVYDVDRPTASYDWYDNNSPPPNLVVTNLKNGHAHLLYSLAVPVLQAEESSLKAQRFLGAVDIALTRKLEADPGYAGLISKNPIHKHWFTRAYQEESYDLNWLADYLDMSDLTDRRRRLPDIASGRNVNLFNDLRRWAYRAYRKGWETPWLGFEYWLSDVAYQAQMLNLNFDDPLPLNEVHHTAKSVSKFCWEKLSPEGFREWQRAMNKRSQAVRKGKAHEKWLVIQEALRANPGASYRELEQLTGMSKSTIYDLRKQYD